LQPIARGPAIQVLVAGQHCAVDDLAWNRHSLEPLPDTGEQFGVDQIAKSIGGVDDRGITRLIRPHALVLEHARIMLDHAVGDNHVADRQRRIKSAGHTGENDCAAAESVGQQSGDERGVDLAHPRAGQHHIMPIDCAGIEDGVRRVLATGVGESGAQVCELLRDRADESNGTRTWASNGTRTWAHDGSPIT
jgi:hypothetical protein